MGDMARVFVANPTLGIFFLISTSALGDYLVEQRLTLLFLFAVTIGILLRMYVNTYRGYVRGIVAYRRRRCVPQLDAERWFWKEHGQCFRSGYRAGVLRAIEEDMQ